MEQSAHLTTHPTGTTRPIDLHLSGLLPFPDSGGVPVGKDALAKMKAKVMASIEEGRRLMGLDLLVRTNTGEIATERNCSIMELYRMVS